MSRWPVLPNCDILYKNAYNNAYIKNSINSRFQISSVLCYQTSGSPKGIKCFMHSQTVPHRKQQTSGRPLIPLVMGAHSFPLAVCIHVFIKRRQGVKSFERWKQNVGRSLGIYIICQTTYLWHHFWQGIFQFFQKLIRVVAFLWMKRWTTLSQYWMCNSNMRRNCFVQLTTSLRRNGDHQSTAVLHRSSGRSESRRRRGARGNGLVPDIEICVSNSNITITIFIFGR